MKTKRKFVSNNFWSKLKKRIHKIFSVICHSPVFPCSAQMRVALKWMCVRVPVFCFECMHINMCVKAYASHTKLKQQQQYKMNISLLFRLKFNAHILFLMMQPYQNFDACSLFLCVCYASKSLKAQTYLSYEIVKILFNNESKKWIWRIRLNSVSPCSKPPYTKSHGKCAWNLFTFI